MLFSKKALGIEICSDGARIALVGGKPDMPSLTAFGTASFPADTLKFSLRPLVDFSHRLGSSTFWGFP